MGLQTHKNFVYRSIKILCMSLKILLHFTTPLLEQSEWQSVRLNNFLVEHYEHIVWYETKVFMIYRKIEIGISCGKFTRNRDALLDAPKPYVHCTDWEGIHSTSAHQCPSTSLSFWRRISPSCKRISCMPYNTSTCASSYPLRTPRLSRSSRV